MATVTPERRSRYYIDNQNNHLIHNHLDETDAMVNVENWLVVEYSKLSKDPMCPPSSCSRSTGEAEVAWKSKNQAN